MKETAYPLDWPAGWKRTASRTAASFGKVAPGEFGVTRRTLSIEEATRRVLGELKRMRVSEKNVIVSTNLKLRKLDRLPQSGQANPLDPGAAVYWRKGNVTQCMAIDRYVKVQDNLAAIAATLEAMRAIERHGGATILDRAFIGFKALAAPEQPFQVLGVRADATPDQVNDAWRRLASKHHPDNGGNEQAMMRINAARDAMLEG